MPRLSRLAPVALAACVAGSLSALAASLPPASPEMLEAVRRAAPHGCNATTAAALEAAGIAPASVRGVVYYNNSVSADVGRSAGLDAYVKLSDQPGSLVVQHRGGCDFGGIYASGGARLPRKP